LKKIQNFETFFCYFENKYFQNYENVMKISKKTIKNIEILDVF